MKVNCVDSSSKLVCFVIVVEIVLKFGSQKDSYQHHFINIEVIESEVLELHVVSIDINDRDDQALRGILCVFVESFEEV